MTLRRGSLGFRGRCAWAAMADVDDGLVLFSLCQIVTFDRYIGLALGS